MISDADPQGSTVDWFNQRKKAGIESPLYAPLTFSGLPDYLRSVKDAGASCLFTDTAPSIGGVNPELFAETKLQEYEAIGRIWPANALSAKAQYRKCGRTCFVARSHLADVGACGRNSAAHAGSQGDALAWFVGAPSAVTHFTGHGECIPARNL